MGYDGGFYKIRMKLNTQVQVRYYEMKLRKELSKMFSIYNSDDFYDFENLAVELHFLDNDWTQVYGFNYSPKLIEKNFELEDDNYFTLITKETLKDYIEGLKIYTRSDDFKKRYNISNNDSEKQLIKDVDEDIKLLEKLYKEFDWDNDTLLFSYSY